MMKILVTGGAGYIGSHCVLALQERGYDVLVLDNLVYGHRDFLTDVLQVDWVQGDVNDRVLLDEIFTNYKIGAVLHFAAYAYVGESVQLPAKYYRNNVGGSLTLLEAMVAHRVPYFIFSSTCATYGVPQVIPIPETHPQQPINPYGKSKLMVEQMLTDLEGAYGIRSVIFRYFNAAGADPQARLGEDHNPETHLIPLVFYAALGKRSAISIYGTDYPTHDGTCIRDYVHVMDLAEAHVLGLEYLLAGNPSDAFNLGNGNGFSVKEVIDCAQTVCSKSITVVMTDRRPGDPPILVGSSDKAKQILGWQPRYYELKQILTDAWRWHQKRHG
ncbi:MAG: UDP-glucose 4-epimerase GalE [Pseudanabaenaceae cyanobacterium SKYGB_i_bin29]|nr:UDP-glucose 4-epimerase GalE [Pseudanabaenaceae cyanobacterium SKYG29]MDW8422668.1 UDP-glucose 4-epimerase GalE [Pseudanabaenaceae cyanobacterium SKYGB_i_bin29]